MLLDFTAIHIWSWLVGFVHDIYTDQISRPLSRGFGSLYKSLCTIPVRKSKSMHACMRVLWMSRCSRASDVFIFLARQKKGALPALKNLIVEDSWKNVLSAEFEKHYFGDLERFMHAEWRGKTPIYPPIETTFRAFNSSPFNDVKVVILGQV